MSEAMGSEVRIDPDDRDREIARCETRLDYPEVDRLFRVIDTDTRLVIVDARCIERVESGDMVPFRTLQRNSVQIWANKLDSLPVRDLTEDDELYAWEGNYDPLFLGYMAEVVPALERGNDPGAAVI